MNLALAIAPVSGGEYDLQTGLQILSQLPLADSQRAAVEINAFLDNLLQTPPQGDVYLQLLEQTRITLCFVNEELARRYANKALPLNDTEAGAFRLVVATWLKAAQAYSQCAQRQLADERSGKAERLALILHRCIYYTGMAMVEHYRSRQELPSQVWFNLHRYYASAEKYGVATWPVADSLDSLGRNRDCSGAYVSLLLLDVAGPYGLSSRDLGLARRWVDHWASLVSVHQIQEDSAIPNPVIDLARSCGLHAATDNQARDTLRRMEPARLATQLNHVRKQLKLGVSPTQLGLGEDCTAGHCYQLVKRLYGPWCTSRVARKFHRHSASGVARIAAGFSAMHYHISGKEFKQPASAGSYSRREFESLFVFRHSLGPERLLEVRQAQLGFGLDRWEILDQSASGFRLRRSAGGRKMERGQLLSICPREGGSHFLAQVVWLIERHRGDLVAGISALPGKPQAVGARPSTEVTGAAGEYCRAFILPAVEAIGAEQSLILPPGWYRPERQLELDADRPMRVQLHRRLGGGIDFERVSFIFVCG